MVIGIIILWSVVVFFFLVGFLLTEERSCWIDADKNITNLKAGLTFVWGFSRRQQFQACFRRFHAVLYRALTVLFTVHCFNSDFFISYFYVIIMDALQEPFKGFWWHSSYILATLARSNSFFNLVCNSWVYYKISAKLMKFSSFPAALGKWQPIYP